MDSDFLQYFQAGMYITFLNFVISPELTTMSLHPNMKC